MRKAKKTQQAEILNPIQRPAAAFLLLFLLLVPVSSQAFWPFDPPDRKDCQAEQSDAVYEAEAERRAAMQVDEAAELQEQIQAMAQELFSNLEDADPEVGVLADGLIVCSFVDLKKLYRTSSFGRYLAEQLMGEMQRRKYRVVELRKSSDVLMQQKRGEYGLSRDPRQVSDTVAAGAMLTGTYTPTPQHIIVNAKIVDNRTATLLSSATVVFPRNQLCTLLLSDSATASARQPEPIYMKRLQL